MLVIDPNLIFQIVDNLFGGVGRAMNISEGREFTATESRIVQNLLSVVFSEYEKAWHPIYQIKCEFVRSEINTRFASIALPTEVVIVSSFNITLGDGVSGDFQICLPYTMIQPIRDILYSSLQGDQTEVDGMWVKLLRQQIQLAEINLISNLCVTSATLRQIMHMKKGDVVPIEIPEAVVAKVDGVPIFECKYGTSNGQYALKVGKVLSISQKIT
jgi:flagellar motor switch protein FliM